MILSVFPLGIFASSLNPNEWRDLSSTSIAEDFEYVFANKFDKEDFKENNNDGVEEENKVISLVSVMQSYNYENECTDLFLYLYNPYRKEIYRKSDKNNLHLSVYNGNNNKDEHDYSKIKVELVDTYENTAVDENVTNALLLKYRVPNVFKGQPGGLTRCYNLVEFELLEKDKPTAQAYLIGRTFEFTLNEIEGEEYKYVTCVDKELNVLETDVFHTFYRINSEGINKYKDVQSVYFAVPNALIKSYGSLWSLKCVWDTYQTNNILVTGDSSKESLFENWMYGNNPFSTDFDYAVVYGENSFFINEYKYAYNVESISKYIDCWDGNILGIDTRFEKDGVLYRTLPYDFDGAFSTAEFEAPEVSYYDYPLSMVFYSDNVESYEEKIVDGQDILDYINSHRIYEDGQFVLDDTMFSEKESNETTFRVFYSLDVGGVWEKCSGWSAFWNGMYYDVPTDEHVSLDVFQEIDNKDVTKMSREEFSKKYFVEEEDFRCLSGECEECLQCRVTDEKYKDSTWFLLRYDITDYESYSALICDSNNSTTQKACVFNGGVIDNFDTLEVTLRQTASNGETVFNTFPIGRSPSQFAVDGWSPEELPKFPDLIKTNFGAAFEWLETVLKIAFIVIAVLFIVKVVLPLLPKRTKIKIEQGKERKNENKK